MPGSFGPTRSNGSRYVGIVSTLLSEDRGYFFKGEVGAVPMLCRISPDPEIAAVLDLRWVHAELAPHQRLQGVLVSAAGAKVARGFAVCLFDLGLYAECSKGSAHGFLDPRDGAPPRQPALTSSASLKMRRRRLATIGATLACAAWPVQGSTW